MGIFNFFKRNKQKADNSKPDINTLLLSDNLNQSIIDINTYINVLSVYGEKIELLTQPQLNFYLIQNLEREINNGGFNQFFYNSSGDFTHETITALKAIGAAKIVQILIDAISIFPNGIVPKERLLRQDLLEQLDEKIGLFLEGLDNKFLKYEDDLMILSINYIKENREFF